MGRAATPTTEPSSAGTPRPVTSPAAVVDALGLTPDPAAARRAVGRARRVARVELVEGAAGWDARVTAVWHRVPRATTVSPSAAAALALAGVPTSIRREVLR